MPLRSQAKIRRDINRLHALIGEHRAVHAELDAIEPEVSASTTLVNETWRAYQDAAVTASKEIRERNVAITDLLRWSRSWRNVVVIKVPGARENIRELPATGATPDDLVRLATDLQVLIVTRPQAAAFKEKAIAQLGTKIEDASRETKEATLAVPAKQAARTAYARATAEANLLLVEASDIVRNVFGPKSREYKQFIARATATEEAEDDRDSDEGEDDDDIVVDGERIVTGPTDTDAET